MPEGQPKAVLEHVVELIAQGRIDEVSDGQLLELYARALDESAFSALVRRHGSMVLAIAQRVLHELHDAEDVFQATFFILARKASSLEQQRRENATLAEAALARRRHHGADRSRPRR